MPRHRAPRSPFRHRILALGGSLFAASAAALGVLVAHHDPDPTTTEAQLGSSTTAPASPTTATPSIIPPLDALASAGNAQASSLAAASASRSSASASASASASRAAASSSQRKAETPSRAPAPAPATMAPTRTQPPPTASSSTGNAYKDYALKQLGGDATQFGCLDKLWTRESGWNPAAQNPSSTAYGIAQLLNGTWLALGLTKSSDPFRQIDAGLTYIRRTYGTPCAAWGHSENTGWY